MDTVVQVFVEVDTIKLLNYIIVEASDTGTRTMCGTCLARYLYLPKCVLVRTFLRKGIDSVFLPDHEALQGCNV